MAEIKKYKKEELDTMGLFELRILARNIGVAKPTKPRKEDLIQKIIEVQDNKSLAVPVSKLGRPVKPTALQSIINIGEQSVTLTYGDHTAERPVFAFEDVSTQHEFDLVSQIHEKEKLNIWDGKSITNQIVDILAPIEKGGKAVISGPAKSGKTYLMHSLARGIIKMNSNVRVLYLSIDEPPENTVLLDDEPSITQYITGFVDGSFNITKYAEETLYEAKTLAQSHDVVLFIDSMDRLGREFTNFSESPGFVSSVRIVTSLKKFLSGAKRTADGSLTIITAFDPFGVNGSDLLNAELNRYATTSITLDGALSEKKIYPAINVKATMTRQDEMLLDMLTYQNNVRIRRQMLYMEPDKAILQYTEES